MGPGSAGVRGLAPPVPQPTARDTGPLRGGSDRRTGLAFARKGPHAAPRPAAGAAISQREQTQASGAAAARVAPELVLPSDVPGTRGTGARRIQRWFCVLAPSSSGSHERLDTAYSTGCPLTRLPRQITARAPCSSAPYLPYRHPGAEKRVSVSNPRRAPSSGRAGRGKTVAPHLSPTISPKDTPPPAPTGQRLSPPRSGSPRVALPLPPLPLRLEAEF